jgi:hypothetical protein
MMFYEKGRSKLPESFEVSQNPSYRAKNSTDATSGNPAGDRTLS